MSNSLDLEKIIIITECKLRDKQGLNSVAISMVGGRVDAMVCFHSVGEESDKEELISELYDDCYEPDDIDVEAIEALNGEHVATSIVEFIVDNWSEETMIMVYKADEKMFEFIADKVLETSCDMVVTDYHDIFTDKRDTQRDIYQIMESVGIQSNMLLDGSIVCLAYFLGVLVDKLLDR